MINSQQAKALLKNQLHDWPLAKDNYQALEQIQLHAFDMGGFHIKVQYTPSRIISSGAKIDFRSIKDRPCFLCSENQPTEQEGLAFGADYRILCNPYPIFPEHFTIPASEHTDQLILPRLGIFLELASCLSDFTLFYNGPKSGASAPDHAHFQAVTRYVMPIEEELDYQLQSYGRLLLENANSRLYLLTHYLRNGFVIKAKTKEGAVNCFETVYNTLELNPEEVEPMMNLFAYYEREEWTVILIPRKQHRPHQFFEEGDNCILVSPGAADMGGLFVTSRLQDFEKMNPLLLKNIYEQVCFSDPEMEEIAVKIVNQNNL